VGAEKVYFAGAAPLARAAHQLQMPAVVHLSGHAWRYHIHMVGSLISEGFLDLSNRHARDALKFQYAVFCMLKDRW
jgi:hypothetical protein